MSTLTELKVPSAISVNVTDEDLTVELADGRRVTVPTEWFPRLLHGDVKERGKWELIGLGSGIHWEDLDEDISVESLVLGYPSAESLESLQKWLTKRSQNK